jgi:hypothetical protein
VRRELAALGVHTFGDLRRDDPGDDPALAPSQRYRLVVTTTDVTRGRLLRRPWDYLDRGYLAQLCVRRRAFSVDTSGTGLTEFDIGAAERAQLVASGAPAAREFLARWDWADHLRECRGVDPQG